MLPVPRQVVRELSPPRIWPMGPLRVYLLSRGLNLGLEWGAILRHASQKSGWLLRPRVPGTNSCREGRARTRVPGTGRRRARRGRPTRTRVPGTGGRGPDLGDVVLDASSAAQATPASRPSVGTTVALGKRDTGRGKVQVRHCRMTGRDDRERRQVILHTFDDEVLKQCAVDRTTAGRVLDQGHELRGDDLNAHDCAILAQVQWRSVE